jgi:uncharacterized protein YqfA (UPF0365 family)
MPVSTRPDTLIIVMIVVALALVVVMFALGHFVSLYIQCLLSNCRVGFIHILAMRLRRVDLRAVLYSHIRAVKAGLDLGPSPVAVLERHTLAGGKAPEVVSALMVLKAAGIPASWDVLATADLAGRDVLAAAQAADRSKAQGSPITLERAIATAPRR